MTLMETYCTECDHTPRSTTPYCPECGSEDPWDERPAYQFDEDDLPYIIEYEFHEDNWELWDEFCNQYFGTPELTGEDIAGLPDEFPRLKYNVVTVYWVITEEYDVEGPFLEKPETPELIA